MKVGYFWSVGLIVHNNSFQVVFGPLLAPKPNFIQISRKTQKFLLQASFGWSVW